MLAEIWSQAPWNVRKLFLTGQQFSSEHHKSVLGDGDDGRTVDDDGAVSGTLAAEIYRTCHLEGNFTLRSGRVTSSYFDKYQFEARPRLLGRICEALAPLIPTDTEVLAGLELGGVPVVTLLSSITGLPAAFIRKEAKKHGTARLAEGAGLIGRRILVVEDVVTSGGQISLSTEELRRLGAIVGAALCVVDRQDGGLEALRDQGVELISLFTAAELEHATRT